MGKKVEHQNLSNPTKVCEQMDLPVVQEKVAKKEGTSVQR